jgi:hypothetical protein
MGGTMKKERNDVNELREIKIVSTGYTRPGSHNAEDEVNRLLNEGWQILETYITCYSNFPPLTSQQEVHFVLGKREVSKSEQVICALRA